MNDNRLIKGIKHPEWVFGVILRRCFARFMDDRTFIKWEYLSGMRKFPNIENPTTYNEKLQWLKLNDIHPEYGKLVCKYDAKEYVRGVLGDDVIIPTLGIWDKFEDIDFDKLPNQFVLKTTHDSGGVVVVKDKKKINLSKVRAKIMKSYNHDYFLEHREYPYKFVKPRIIAEKYMVDESGKELKDYKFFCFDGEVKMLLIATERSTGDLKSDFFDSDFNHLPFTHGHQNAKKEIKKPAGFEKMKEIAAILSKGFPHIRVDLYDINGHIYFGELTFFSSSGNVPFEPEEWDYKIGEWLKLPT